MSYKKDLLEEVYICIKHLKLSYTDVMKMPTFERRFFLVTLQNELIDAKEKQESGGVTRSTGKGTRTTSISGAALTSKLKNKEIPNG